MYKQYLALNNPQWLICHKTKPNKVIGLVWFLYLMAYQLPFVS